MESQHTEWKEAWRDAYLRWVCGFANACFRASKIKVGSRLKSIFHPRSKPNSRLQKYRLTAQGRAWQQRQRRAL